jgi:hypothetical protein
MRTAKINLIYMIAFLVVMTLGSAENIKAQGYLLRVGAVATDYFDNNGTLEFGNGNFLMGTGMIGLGVTPPIGRIHIRSNFTLTTPPQFVAEIWDPFLGTALASIQNLVKIDNVKYGIYQSSDPSYKCINYFQDPLKVGNLTIGNESASSTITTNWGTDSICFKMAHSGPSYATPLTIYSGGIRIYNQLITDRFQLLTNAGPGRILASDQLGNGIWTDASNYHDDDWLIESFGEKDIPTQNLYANPKYENVGIGTTSPKSKLHIMDGNILISRSPSKAPGSRNGSILFGEVISETCPLGEWGIEYNTGNTEYIMNGLNFWKPYSGNSNGFNYCLFLKNDGNVGIGTQYPFDKLQVNDSYLKVTIGGADANDLYSGNGYIGFNAVRQRLIDKKWLLNSNGTNNGGAVIWSGMNGSFYLATVAPSETPTTNQLLTDAELASRIKFTLLNQGNIGIGTPNPLDKLQINDGIGKISFGSIIDVPLNGTGYVGFNAVHYNSSWSFSGDGSKNGGGLIYTDKDGKMKFGVVASNGGEDRSLTDETIGDKIKMTINPNGKVFINGYLGIMDANPQSPISIYTPQENSVWMASQGNYPALYWAVNDFPTSMNKGVAFGIDEEGIGHIYENPLTRSSVLSFHSGKVGIGDFNVNDYSTSTSKLFVEGGITTEAVTVKLKADGWSDFVFNADYKQRSITDLEQYIKENKHLPDIPTTEDVRKSGIELGEMNAKLLMKIEELTLYVIELKKEITVLKSKINK